MLEYKQWGGGIVGETTSSKLVDADHLVGYQLPSDKLSPYDFYFSSNSGCNLPLTFSRKLYSDTTYSGINAGNNPTLSFVKSTNTSTTDGNIGRNLWDQLDVPNKMKFNWINSSATAYAARSFLLSMSMNTTTYGDNNKYYYLGQVIIVCGQAGAKAINLYYRRTGNSYTVQWIVILRNTTSRFMSDIRVPYTITKNGSSVSGGTMSQATLGPGVSTSLVNYINSATTGTYTINIGVINYKIYPGSTSSGTPSNRSISGGTITAACPQTQSYQRQFNLT